MFLDGISKRIRSRREERGLKQADIANALQVSAQAVSKWERGENAPDIALLGGLAKLLGVSTDWILGLHEETADVFEATVFVSAVQGYAKKASQSPPREMATWANRFFYHLTEAIIKKDGVPIKQVGDGLLCFFSGVRHRERAVTAALDARSGAEEAITIALSSGEIYLGSIGHPDYEQPDIMGDTVNVAFQTIGVVSDVAKSGIVATESVIDGAEHECKIKGPVVKELAFIPRPVKLYEIDF